MSFMFNPHPYDDPRPVNRPRLSAAAAAAIAVGTAAAARRIAEAVNERRGRGGLVVTIDGYPTAPLAAFAAALAAELRASGVTATVLDTAACFRKPGDLDRLLAPCLPQDREQDPVLLFGRLFEGEIGELMQPPAIAEMAKAAAAARARGEVALLAGWGAASGSLRGSTDLVVWMDVTPKQAVLRLKGGRARNLGDDRNRPFAETLRRAYYVDFEVAARLRRQLLQQRAIDFYGTIDAADEATLLPAAAFDELCSSLARSPLRCRPVYIEGVWGGTFLKRMRGLPDAMRNCAWSFELIPLEVSVVAEVGTCLFEMPFFTLVQKEGEALMGRRCLERFGGYFPIRFNYDDSFHSNGNMSIQVHPTEEYARERFNEHGRQDESYYIVATGHGARTFVGFHDRANVDEFLAAVRRSETHSEPVDYERFVNAEASRPGMQFLLPAGTIHSSGRNQIILEIGSLTVGSYTFKLYDYLRLDLEGKPRPIHTYYGAAVLRRERTASWVRENLVPAPRLVRQGPGWSEQIVGEHDLLYFSLRRLELEKEIEGDTEGQFHVLTLVDGEKIRVESASDPAAAYEASWLDVVLVPAAVGRYVVRNLGDQPICVHKTHLRQERRA